MDERIIEAITYLAQEIDDINNWRRDDQHRPDLRNYAEDKVTDILNQPGREDE